MLLIVLQIPSSITFGSIEFATLYEFAAAMTIAALPKPLLLMTQSSVIGRLA